MKRQGTERSSQIGARLMGDGVISGDRWPFDFLPALHQSFRGLCGIVRDGDGYWPRRSQALTPIQNLDRGFIEFIQPDLRQNGARRG
jgi:hypothetical protein